MTNHDQLFKNLLEAFWGDLLRIVVPHLVPRLRPEKSRFLSQELFTDLPQGDHRRVDLLAEVPARRGKPEMVLVHVEIQRRAHAEMARRLRRYAMQIELRHDRPVLPILLDLKGGTPDVTREVLRQRLWGEELASFTYFAFGLSPSQAEPWLARPEPLAWALAALMRPTDLTPARHKLECLRPIARADLDEARRFCWPIAWKPIYNWRALR